jgi:hypothetical protein
MKEIALLQKDAMNAPAVACRFGFAKSAASPKPEGRRRAQCLTVAESSP